MDSFSPPNPYIALSDCKDGALYRIWSRNLDYGVFRASTRGFIGVRDKFGTRYLFEEYHWDNGPPFGTVKPRVLVEMCPITPLEEDNDELFAWLEAVPRREALFYTTGTGQRIGPIHDVSRCANTFCVIHNPSDHHMVSWPTNWRGDRRLMERLCEHAVGHPDPDDRAFAKRRFGDDDSVHSCDGCCGVKRQ